MVEEVSIRLYSPAGTVADCFRYRNKIGIGVALEALRDCWSLRRATMDEIWRAAEVCRVINVMRPDLESLLLVTTLEIKHRTNNLIEISCSRFTEGL